MFKKKDGKNDVFEIISRSQTLAKYDVDGNLLWANDNFLGCMGYTLDALKGRHHSTLCSDTDTECDAFWHKVTGGQYHSEMIRRNTRTGEPVWIQASFNPILDKRGDVSHILEIGFDISETGRALEASTLHTSALKGMSANIMIADNDRNILFMNDALKHYFESHQTAIRRDFSDFDPNKLIGTRIDRFHKNPVHQEKMLASMKEEFQAELTFGGRTTRVIAVPIYDADGNRIGTVAEWARHTQLVVEEEIREVVTAALDGDLSQRINVEGKVGFLKLMSESVNHLVGNADAIIKKASGVLRALADGDLTQTLEGDFRGDFKKLQNSVNESVHKLTEVVNAIQTASQSVRSGTEEIARGNAHLSQRTEEQASSLEETASSMEEMTATVRQNAENAARADSLAKTARTQAQAGGQVVRDAVEAMSQIAGSSDKISDIIGVIDEIAFQTNLLALNAAVEAARAGEQGRGFAVVASEVRNLAGRSATAAKEIKDLIQDSGHKVEQGTHLVNKSGETLESIVSGVQEVSDVVGEIAAASQEQSTGIEEVNKAVNQLDELTQQNSALVEEAAAASQAMGNEANRLSSQVAYFTTATSKRRATTAPNSPEATSRIQATDRDSANDDAVSVSRVANFDDDWTAF